MIAVALNSGMAVKYPPVQLYECHTMPRPTVTNENFWLRVDRRQGPDSCWPWLGRLNAGKRNLKAMYGRCDFGGKKGVYVHRISYWITHPGAITLDKQDGIIIRHQCDNSICCNPAHMIHGTHAENVKDMMDRGRETKHGSIGSPNAKLTSQDVIRIRQRRALGYTRQAIADEYSVSLSTIKGVLSGRHYSDVP